jgi:hypothetical protein
MGRLDLVDARSSSACGTASHGSMAFPGVYFSAQPGSIVIQQTEECGG